MDNLSRERRLPQLGLSLAHSVAPYEDDIASSGTCPMSFRRIAIVASS
jgi:hypothetical protein